jgi:hypothetical protein
VLCNLLWKCLKTFCEGDVMFGSLDGYPLLIKKWISLEYELNVLLHISLIIDATKVASTFGSSQSWREGKIM